MKERLVIKNFGPIKSVDLELGKMTILIGEQATGKSTIAKVMAVCRYLNLFSIESHQLEVFKTTLKYWNIDSYLKDNSYIYYKNDDFSKELIDKKLIITPLSEKNISILNNIKSFYEKMEVDFSNFENKDFEVLNNMNISINKSIENSFFIPTERGLQSLFSLGKGSVNNMSDILFEQLSKLSMISKSIKKEIIIKPLDIKFVNKKDLGFVRKKNERTSYNLDNSASGYQSMIPIVLSINFFKNNEQNFIIEEPELNLFPKAQKKLMEFFVENINQNGHSFLLPTHSPYLLSSLTNLMYASNIAKLENGKFKEKVSQIIPEEYWMNVDDVSAYHLENGEAKNLVNKEEGLINIDDLDNVSEIINNEFDRLLSIEVEYQNEQNK